MIYIKIAAAEGAANYWAGYEYKGATKKPCVWMTIKAYNNCDHDCNYVVQSCKTIESAQRAANKWQQKENRAVLKSKNKNQ